MFRELINTDDPILSIAGEDNCLYALCGKRIMKIDKLSGGVIINSQIFEKDGLSRSLIVDDRYLYCKDFCAFYIIDKNSMACIRQLQLGEDLSSDICGMTVDDSNIYACIRNGEIVVIDKNHEFSVIYYKVSDSSIWDISNRERYLYAGNVEGSLLVLDKQRMENIHKIHCHKQNLRSVYVDDERIITASQDKSIVVMNQGTLEIQNIKKAAHKKMFWIAGTWKEYLISISYPCGEIKFWNTDSMELEKTISIPRALTGETLIDGNILYMVSRKINGILFGDLNELIK